MCPWQAADGLTACARRQSPYDCARADRIIVATATGGRGTRRAAAARRPAGAGARADACRIDPPRSPAARRALIERILPADRRGHADRHFRPARRRQIDLHRALRARRHRARAPHRGARGRSRLETRRRRDPRRQDADGRTRRARRRRSSGRPRPAPRPAGWRAARARRSWSARRPGSTRCWSRRSAPARPRRPSPRWSTCSCWCCRPPPATNCRASSAASSNWPI